MISLIPDLASRAQCRVVVLMIHKYTGEAIKIDCPTNDADDVIHMVRAAQRFRKDIFTKEYVFG